MATKNYYSIDSDDKFFCKCDIPNPADATEFLDSATAKTITANGNATQLPIKFNKSAGFFNGTSDYVDISNSTDFAFGTGAFTIEGFFNTGIDATAQTILDTRAATANTTGLLVNIINSTGNKLCVTTATTARITGTTTLAKNTWYHFMVVGNGGANGARTIILYLDGVQEGSTYTNDYNFTDQTLRIGAIKAAAGTYMNGWMKELRISNVARTVAVPTTQYTSDANTVLLMHFDTPATSPLGPAIAFDGTGDMLTLADSNDWNPTTAFTLRLSVKMNVVQASGFIGHAQDGNNFWEFDYDGTYIVFRHAVGGSYTVDHAWAYTFIANKWTNLELVKNGSTWYLFIDGNKQAEKTAAVSLADFSGVLQIGQRAGHSGSYLNGEIRELEFKHSAEHTTSFTPSQTGFTVDANTKLYIKGNEDNGVTTFLDSSTTPKTVTTNGDTKIKYTEDYRSCIFKDETGKFPYPVGSAKVDFFAIGNGVGSFTGATDALLIDSSADLNFGTAGAGDFTVETYGRWKSLAGSTYYGIMNTNDGGNNGWMFYYYHTGYLAGFDGAIKYFANNTFTALANLWYHFAFVRNGGTVTGYINGTAVGTITDGTWNNDGIKLGVGTYRATSPTNPFNGLLDNIRISKGVARYTATFNPPEFRTFIPRAILI